MINVTRLRRGNVANVRQGEWGRQMKLSAERSQWKLTPLPSEDIGVDRHRWKSLPILRAFVNWNVRRKSPASKSGGNFHVRRDNPPLSSSSTRFYAISVPRIPLSLILVPFNTIFMTYCPNINGTSSCHCSKCQCLNFLRVLGPTVGGFHRDGPGPRRLLDCQCCMFFELLFFWLLTQTTSTEVPYDAQETLSDISWVVVWNFLVLFSYH